MQFLPTYGHLAKFDPPNDRGGEDKSSGHISNDSLPSFFLIGHPVGHSLSPLIHNTAFAVLGLRGRYSALDVDSSAVGSAIASIDGATVVGANVTIPYKQAVIPYLEELTPTAKKAGAVNTIFRRDGLLVGENTDIAGFLYGLRAPRAGNLVAKLPENPRVLILGSGGAARAVAHACRVHLSASTVQIAARNEATARGIEHIEFVDWEERKNAAQASDLIVNATPLGMHPSINASPLPDNMSFGPRHTVYDLIYNPDPTLLLEHAAGQGAVTIGGLAMLIGQAAAAFSIWTGQEMPVGEVEKIVREALHTKRRS